MRIILHFLRRDFRDLLVGWIFVAVSFTAILIGRWYRLESFLMMAGTAYVIFFVLTFTHVWQEKSLGAQGLPRAYLLSLPVRRRNLFWISFLRAGIGALPAMVFYLLALGQGPLHERIQWELAAGPPGSAFRIGFAAVVLALSLPVLIQVILFGPTELQRTMRMAFMARRIWLSVATMVSLTVAVCFLSGWVLLVLYPLFVLPERAWDSYTWSELPLGLLGLGSVPYFAWKLRRMYLDWLWE